MRRHNRKGGTFKMNRLRSIDLFAGIGGIRLGFDRAFGDKIDTVFVCEWDEPPQVAARHTHKDAKAATTA